MIIIDLLENKVYLEPQKISEYYPKNYFDKIGIEYKLDEEGIFSSALNFYSEAWGNRDVARIWIRVKK